MTTKEVTHTYVFPNGAAVEISGVPTLWDPQDDTLFFAPEVADHLSDLIDQAAEMKPAPGETMRLEYRGGCST
ncbi:hypothetical protein [Meiothermus granaticius]|uniref:Uncharacterized protein n=1 Tax=Meiothermus granaticius NBRC 107808 TaxID=1227551 RepID=A0A399FCP0_9DEIN|nr:hypothetical protein [Meiothermus granaticius]RIH94010.1 hypothetical protein Mgrana_00096 [Meiothermus granaticius NBRC 107808]GEM88161.1 hypothetical protein MGR01S_27860 [Meiothermus granaticius NBRC 107808]